MRKRDLGSGCKYLAHGARLILDERSGGRRRSTTPSIIPGGWLSHSMAVQTYLPNYTSNVGTSPTAYLAKVGLRL